MRAGLQGLLRACRGLRAHARILHGQNDELRARATELAAESAELVARSKGLRALGAPLAWLEGWPGRT